MNPSEGILEKINITINGFLKKSKLFIMFALNISGRTLFTPWNFRYFVFHLETVIYYIFKEFIYSFILFWALEVSRTASYEITVVRLSVCPSVRPSVRLSVRPSLSFLKIESLVFSDIVHNDSWAWDLLTDGARFLKNNWRPKFGPNGTKSGIFIF